MTAAGRSSKKRKGIGTVGSPRSERFFIYGFHPVLAALENPQRVKHRLLATRNGARRLAETVKVIDPTPTIALPRELDRHVGRDAVHQGMVLEVAPLPTKTIEGLAEARLLLVLDQITDPHNVGAILRSAAAFSVDAVVSTTRHAPSETGVMAKAASGALETVPIVTTRNLADAIEALKSAGYRCVGLDGDAAEILEAAVEGASRLVLVLGAEGKGLRQKTRATCHRTARIELPGSLHSLNVSNAAALALYIARRAIS